MRSLFEHDNREFIFDFFSTVFITSFDEISITAMAKQRQLTMIVLVLLINLHLSAPESSWCGANSHQVPNRKLLFFQNQQLFHVKTQIFVFRRRCCQRHWSKIDQQLPEIDTVPVELLTCDDLKRTVDCIGRRSWSTPLELESPDLPPNQYFPTFQIGLAIIGGFFIAARIGLAPVSILAGRFPKQHLDGSQFRHPCYLGLSC